MSASSWRFWATSGLDANNVDINYFLALVELRLGRSARAKESFERALARKPDFAWAHYRLGELGFDYSGFASGSWQDLCPACKRKTLAGAQLRQKEAARG